VATAASLSDEEHARVVKMNTDVLNLIIDYATVRDGRPDTGCSEQAAERRKGAVQHLDLDFALELTDRLGEEDLRRAVEESVPVQTRAPLETLAEQGGGMLRVIKNRIGQLRPGAEIAHKSDATACGLGAFAILAGVTLDGVLGGIAAVGGIMVVAAEC
jgi:hypothetical protein